MIKLVIFYLDGTLLDSIADLAASMNYALEQFGFPVHELPAYRYFVGNGITKLTERTLPEDERTEKRIAEVRAFFVDYYQRHKTDFTCPYPGIQELLKKLKQQGIVMAVASNKFDEATKMLVHHYFGVELFSIILGQREGVPVKPDPAIVTEIIERIKVEREQVLYVGDSGVDMQTARNAGVCGIGVTWGFRPKQELLQNGASDIVEQPLEIIQFID